MALPITVPYTFGNATTAIPLSNLDSDYATVYQAVNGIGNGSVALANVAITGGTISGNTTASNVTVSSGTFTNVTLSNVTISSVSTPITAAEGGTGSSSAFTSGGVVYASSTSVLATSSAFTFNGTNVGFTGNLVVGTSGKGINFSVTPSTSTSELLADYEEGTWTPGKGGGLTVVGTFSSSGTYTKIGRIVFVKGTLSGTTSVAFPGGAVDITNSLPFSTTSECSLLCWNGNYTATATVITSGATVYSVTAMAATTSISFSGTYSV